MPTFALGVGTSLTDMARLVAPLFLTMGFLCLVAAAIVSVSSPIGFPAAMAQVSAYACLGAVTGFIAGNSQEPLVGALLTGTLTLVSALLSYRFGGAADDPRAATVPPIIILLCIGALIGLAVGRSERRPWDEHQEAQDLWKTRLDQVDLPALKLKTQFQQCRALSGPANRDLCDKILSR